MDQIQCFNPCESLDRMEAVSRLGEWIARSGMVGCETKEQGVVVAFTCAMEGIHPIEFGRRYHLISGRPCMRADRMAAEFRQRGGKYVIKELSREACAVEFTFETQSLVVRITFEDAKLAGWALDKNGAIAANWKKTPDDMLFARVISKGVRRLCPEVVAGMYTPEETADFVEAKTVEPPKAPPPIRATTVFDDALAEMIELEPTELDVNVCPVEGKAFGKPWSEWDDNALDTLESCRDVPRIAACMTDGHWAALRAAREASK